MGRVTPSLCFVAVIYLTLFIIENMYFVNAEITFYLYTFMLVVINVVFY